MLIGIRCTKKWDKPRWFRKIDKLRHKEYWSESEETWIKRTHTNMAGNQSCK